MSIESPFWDASERAQKIVKESPVMELVMGTQTMSWTEEPQFHEYFERAQKTGIDTLCIHPGNDPMSSSQFIGNLTRTLKALNERPEMYSVVRTVADIRTANAAGKLAVFFSCQGCSLLENDPEMIGVYRQLGLGYMLLAYNSRYRTGDGCMEPGNAGLTLYGKQVVEAMNRYGMVLDLSHTGERTALDATEYSTAPVIYSHSNPKSVCDNPRNITDEQIKTCAETGGIVAPTFVGYMISNDFPTVVTPEHCVNAIDHIVQVAGIDHVGISSDDMFVVKPLEDYARKRADAYDDNGVTLKAANNGSFCVGEPAKILPAIVDGLFAKGYTDDDVRKVIGGNSMRVFEQVWR